MESSKISLFSLLGVRKLSDKAFLLLSLFLTVSLAGLMLSVQAALSIRNISPAVDTAGRQRMLTQRMLSRAYLASTDPAHAVLEGLQSLAEFETALAALRDGGTAGGLRLSPAPRGVRGQFNALEARWAPFRRDLEWLLGNTEMSSSPVFKRRLAELELESEPLLAAAQDVVTALRLHSQKRLNTAVLLLLALAAACAAVFFLASRALRRALLAPLEELTAAADNFRKDGFRAPPAGGRDDELGALWRSFGEMYGDITKDRNAQKITSDLLALSVRNDTVDVFMEKALDAVLAAPWLTVKPKGAIFLADNYSKALSMKTQRGLHASLKKTCAEVPFGHCLCGRAAESGELVFAENLDDRHENAYADIAPHGHYCVPLRTGGSLVGVMTLYLEAGHTYSPEETTQLENIGGLLAEVIEKKRTQSKSLEMTEIIRQASEAVFITGIDGRITYVNDAFEKTTGFSAREAIGQKPNLLKSGEHPAEYYAEMWTSMQKGVPWTGRIVNKRKDGAFYTVQANIFPLKDAAGGVTAYVAIQEDVSALTDIEEQLRQSQKMEAVGRLAGGVAHDFNNILMAIDGHARFIAPALGGDTQAQADLAEIRKSVDRATSLTRQLLAFSRKQRAAFQPLDLRRHLLESEKMLRRLIGENITLGISAGEAGIIKADPGQLDQILVNLLVNARDAMPDGGGLEIKVLRHELALPVPTLFGVMPRGGYAVLSVRDSGHGMDGATMKNIFDPFFTTKPKGKGTGLGLSIVYGIIKHHGAYLTVASQPGKGAAFTAYFPVLCGAQEKPDTATPQGAAAAAVPPGLTVFLAEDDPSVMASVTRMLREFCAEVKAFPDPVKLLTFAAEYQERIDLLITDIVMPGMDGFALAERLAAKKPGTAVIYMSGYTDPDIFRGRLEKPGILFLQKPFGAELLAQAMAKALAGRVK
ncbi:MAG: PAS domain S-box protein [Elusimicrobia bacterium]|nr:PAS domain S-box protein [Elusimicrobiota bacterium]